MGAIALRQEDIVDRLDELPTLPSIVYELNQVINDPMSSTKDVEKIMENDQSMTAKILRLVNSAYYAIPGGVSSLGRAIAYIGYDTVNQLVLSASIIQAIDVSDSADFSVNNFWKHSVGVAIAAETIATKIGHPMPSDMFTCGLVHDMGKLALYSIDKDILLAITRHAKENGVSYHEAEIALELPSHNQIGRMLAEKWSLPTQFQSVIRHHHQPDPNLRSGLSADMNQNVDITLLANILIHALKFGDSGYEKISGAPKDVMERLGINPEEGFKPLVREIKANLDNASDFVSVLGG